MRINVIVLLAGAALVSAGCADGFSLGVRGQAESEGQVVLPVTTAGNGQEGQPTDSGSGQATLPPPSSVPNDGSGPVNTAPTTAPPTTAPSTSPPPTTAPPTTAPPTTAPPTTAPPTTQPSTTAPPTTEPPLSNITVTLIRFQAISDCDGIEGIGEFGFRAYVSTPDGTVHGEATSSVNLSDNEYENQLADVSLQLPQTQGREFTVHFQSSEIDKDIFGTVYNDSRMDGLTIRQTHVYSNGLWTSPVAESTGLGGTYPTAIQLRNGSGDCSAELHYVLDIG